MLKRVELLNINILIMSSVTFDHLYLFLLNESITLKLYETQTFKQT